MDHTSHNTINGAASEWSQRIDKLNKQLDSFEKHIDAQNQLLTRLLDERTSSAARVGSSLGFQSLKAGGHRLFNRSSLVVVLPAPAEDNRSFAQKSRGGCTKRGQLHGSCGTFEARVCFGSKCMAWREALRYVAAETDAWRRALDATASARELKGTRIHCMHCNASALALSLEHPGEQWNVSGGADRIDQLLYGSLYSSVDTGSNESALCRRSVDKQACRKHGAVPRLLSAPRQNLHWRQFRRYRSQHMRTISFLPCSTSRGEDAAVLHSFFTDRRTGRPLTGGTFLEIGAVDGHGESNTWIFESCLGWQGVLIEAHPLSFARLRRNRPRSLNLRMAACHTDGWVDFTARASSTAGVVTIVANSTRRQSQLAIAREQHRRVEIKTSHVECGPLGPRVRALGVHRLDFVSIDVEGAETLVTESLIVPGLSLGVVLVEVRNDGQRPQQISRLLGCGMRYVGQLEARGSMTNYVIDDVYVNMSHLRRYFPTSVALGALRSARSSGPSSRAQVGAEVIL